ncbi:hypothetical protein CVT24_005504 [Panaeolus cyanescens]|uniref:Xylanolytic transcriptional activator regulatory domain-containing protein n=1 Tax=Panaeolus cyanescens TaxID=181874 RepID=A0A409YC13_9AGAR|nr:hypothetical protein CVT24_005504 [Panaeolus cyanescens]
MPVDNTRVISSRRTQKALTEEELRDIDRKRARGILAAGQGTRFILASTTQLHDKIYEMSNRIRQLEDALAILQSMVSDQRHPLLTDELLRIKFGSEAINARENPTEPAADDEMDGEAGEGGKDGAKRMKGKGKDKGTNEVEKSIDALGTLTLGSSGEVQYFGRSAGSEKADEETPSIPSDDELASPSPQDPYLRHLSAVDRIADLFPFTGKHRRNHAGIALIESFLPSYDQARELCLSYIDHGSLFFRALKKDELLDELLPMIYHRNSTEANAHTHNVDGDPVSSQSPESTTDVPPQAKNVHDPDPSHNLAVLFFVFALGALLDPNRKPFNAEAEKYYDLGRAGLSCRSVYENPGVDSVRAMGLMAAYCSLAGRGYTRDNAWCVMSFAAKLAQSLGLHRDSARWNLDPAIVQRRRSLFWEVFSSDVSNSLALGRPPAIHLSYVDCEFPNEEFPESAASSPSATPSSPSSAPKTPSADFWRMKHSFARDIYNSVAQTTLSADAVDYNVVLDLDKKVREISFPVSFNPYVGKEEVGPAIFHSSHLALRDFYASQHRTVTMIYLHRSFFAQAMLDYPTNPFLSPFAPSFLTAFRCASIIIKASAHLFERSADMALRVWFLMYHTFSAAIIVGTVMTRLPNSNITPIAIRDFDLALSIFERSAPNSQRAKTALNVLTKLKEKAVRISSHLQPNPSQGPSTPGTGTKEEKDKEMFGTMDDLEDDLAIFGGQMKVLDRKGKGGAQGRPQQGSISPQIPQGPAGSPQQQRQRQRSSHRRSESITLTLSPGAPSSTNGISSPVSPEGVSGSPIVPEMPPPSLGTTAATAAPPQGTQTDFQGNAWDLGTGLPEVHPSLITYLSQDVVKRALDFEYGKGNGNTGANTGVGDTPGGGMGGALGGNSFYGAGLGTTAAAGGYGDTRHALGGPSYGWNNPGSGHSSSSVHHHVPTSSLYGPQNMVNTMGVHDGLMNDQGRMQAYSQQGMVGPQSLTSNGRFGAFMPINMMHGMNRGVSHGGDDMSRGYNPGFVETASPSSFMGLQQPGYGGGFMGPPMASSEQVMINPMGPTHMGYNGNRVGMGFNGTDPSRAVEMGLASESGMDLGWVTFMQDCGIMDTQEG